MQSAINNPVKTLQTITVEHIDMSLLRSQKDLIHGVLSQTDCRLLNSQREALRGVLQLLDVMTDGFKKNRIIKASRRNLSPEEVNQIRDLKKSRKIC